MPCLFFRSKNVIVFHDINIASLTGVDLERVKSLARTENTVAKVFASTASVCPMWIFYTSNERLYKHFVLKTGTGLSQSQSSHAEESVNKKKVSAENLEAVRARFLEMNVHKTPRQDQADLDSCGTFSREHFILGCFDRAMETLEKYTPAHFHSAHLPAYIVSALTKNLDTMEAVMCCSGDTAAAADKKEPEKAKTEPADSVNVDADAAGTMAPSSEAVADCPRQHRKRVRQLQEKFSVLLC